MFKKFHRRAYFDFLMLLGLSAVLHPPVASAQTHDGAPLELSGFSVSESFDIEDGQPLDLANQHFQRVLYRVSKTSATNLQSYTHFSQSVSWQQLSEKTPDYRLWVFERSGSVTSVTRTKLPGPERDDPISSCFLCDCVSQSGESFQVATLTAPSSWRKSNTLNQPIRFVGFLYAMVNVNGETKIDVDNTVTPEAEQIGQTSATNPDQNEESRAGQLPLFVAQRLQWFPQSANESLGVSPSHVLLAQQGVDIGQFDFVQKQNTKPLGRDDATPFFQTLAAVNSIPLEPDVVPLQFNELMMHPTENFGNAVSFRARVKKCSVVQLSGSDSQSNRGFDHYFQLIVFPDLDGQIVVKNPAGEDLVYRRFPVTMCARSLPGTMSPADIENQQILVCGFYFRFWKYQSEFTDQAGNSGQISPLIIAKSPIMVVSDEESLDFLMGTILAIIFLTLAVTWWFLRNSANKSSTAKIDLPDQIDLTGVE